MKPDLAQTPAIRKGGVLALLCAVYFVVILDAAIVRLAIPAIDRDLGLSVASETWVANAYMLTFGTLLLLGGRLADLFGRRRMLLSGVALFALSSLACGLASSTAILVAARAVQGLGAAAMTPAALSILMRTFAEGADRNKAIGIWAAAGGLGASAAWLVGGPLIDALGWQWVFWINVPIGAAIAVLGARLLPESRDVAAPQSFDLAGALSIVLGIGALIYAVVEAPTRGWGSTQTLALLGLGVVLLVAFGAIERRAVAPLIPRRIARSRELLAANVGLGFAAASVYGMVFVLSLYAQQVLGWSALTLGFAGLALPVGVAAGSTIGQALVTRRGPRPVSMVAMVALVLGLFLFSRLPAHSSYVDHMLPALLVFGPAFGAAVTSYSIATLSGVHPDDAGLASGLNNTFESTFGAMGTAIMASVAATHTSALVGGGVAPLPALNEGFQLAFAVAIAFPACGLLASSMIRRGSRLAELSVPEAVVAVQTTQD
jgi:EmrB/QacA subfamily drug resistance transporter